MVYMLQLVLVPHDDCDWYFGTVNKTLKNGRIEILLFYYHTHENPPARAVSSSWVGVIPLAAADTENKLVRIQSKTIENLRSMSADSFESKAYSQALHNASSFSSETIKIVTQMCGNPYMFRRMFVGYFQCPYEALDGLVTNKVVDTMIWSPMHANPEGESILSNLKNDFKGKTHILKKFRRILFGKLDLAEAIKAETTILDMEDNGPNTLRRGQSL